MKQMTILLLCLLYLPAIYSQDDYLYDEIAKIKKELKANRNRIISLQQQQPKAETPNPLSDEEQKRLNEIAADIKKYQEQIEKLKKVIKGGVDESLVISSIKKLKEQIEELQDEESSIKQSSAPKAKKKNRFLERVYISGWLQFQSSFEKAANGDKTSDTDLEEAILTFNTDVNRWVQGLLIMKYADGSNTYFYMDKALVTISDKKKTPWFLQIGKHPVPFGSFKTNFETDTLGKDMAYTKEGMMLLGWQKKFIKASAYTFNGSAGKSSSEDSKMSGGANIKLSFSNRIWSANFGIDYINNFADSATITSKLTSSTAMKTRVDGMAVNTIINVKKFSLIAEYISALKGFHSDDLLFNSAGARPSILQVETAYTSTLAGRKAILALSYQQTKEALVLALPKKRLTLGLIWEVVENTDLSLEFHQNSDYSTSNSAGSTHGTGRDKYYSAIGYLTVKF